MRPFVGQPSDPSSAAHRDVARRDGLFNGRRAWQGAPVAWGREMLLFVGDMHLGRRPARLGAALEQVGLTAHALSPAAGWRATVEHAVEAGARAVVLAGDVVDADKDRFEAYGHLERGVRRLVEAGVAVFGVAGNHDGVVLPRLSQRIEGFTLLGDGGTWERVAVPGDGAPIDLMGWSFPRAEYRQDPFEHASLAAALAGRRAEATLVGVVHGELGASKSKYAPIRRERMEACGAGAFFLGHIHRPDDLAARPMGYLGSLVGLDAGETGARGPWEVRVAGGRVQARQVPLAPVRWEAVEVALDDDFVEAEDVQVRVHEAFRRVGAEATFDDPRLRCVVARVRLTGRLRARAAVRRFAQDCEGGERVLDVGRPWIIERVVDETRPVVDLEALAAQPTPAGRIAARLVALQRGEGGDLLGRASEAAERLGGGKWGELGPGPDLRAALTGAAWRALEALIEQRAGEEVA